MTVYTQGSFDILHEGHINLLDKCAKLGNKVIVGLLTDNAYTAYRGHTPSQTYFFRKKVLEALRSVDYVVPAIPQDTLSQLVEENVDIVVVGTDWYEKDIYAQYNMKPEQLDPILVYHPYTQTISSTKIKERIKNEL